MNYKGKAIYNPSGKAGEYAKWACNFYVGCSNGCTYCYLKKGVAAKTLGESYPTLKQCFADEADACNTFEKELRRNLEALKQYSLFFSFTTDPMLNETCGLTMQAVDICFAYGVPVQILTKNVANVRRSLLTGRNNLHYRKYADRIGIGFTLTGHSEMEPHAASNAERVAAMRELHEAGYRTFASIEPVIDFPAAMKMIDFTSGICDLYRIGLLSGGKYDIPQMRGFVEWLRDLPANNIIYLKKRLQTMTGYVTPEYAGEVETPVMLPPHFVGSDYKLFK